MLVPSNQSEVILVVDDEPVLREIVSEILRCEGLTVSVVGTVAEAREVLQAAQVDLVLTDIMMPNETGLDLIRWIRSEGYDPSIIAMTGFADLSVATDICNSGVFRFLHKPIRSELLIEATRSALAEVQLHRREAQAKKVLQDTNVRLRQEVVDGLIDNQKMFMGTLGALAIAIDARDPYTHQHSQSVSTLSRTIARQMGLGAMECETIRDAGLVHDIGKIGVSEAILLKPDKLTDDEYQTMKEHPEIGATILEPVPMLSEIVPLVRMHHERFDGRGYPLGLSGTEIALGARIMAVCDAWNAMTTDRPYRKALPFETARRVLEEEKGRQFDPEVVRCFLELPDAVIRAE